MSDDHTTSIRLRLRELAQLFNSMDPSPFVDRDLDADAEEYIVSWAREAPTTHKFELVIHLAEAPSETRGLEDAVRHYFSTRAEIKRREFVVLMRRARWSLFVGLLFLAGCLLCGELIGKWSSGAAANIAREGLTIGGWVAMWRPLEIYLYEWWPLRDERRLLERLGRMKIRLVLPGAKRAPRELEASLESRAA